MMNFQWILINTLSVNSKKIEKSPNKLVYDFYLEKPLYLSDHEKQKRGNHYLGDLSVTLSNYVDYDPTTDVMKISKLGKNLRIHLVDMRENILYDIWREFMSSLYGLSNENNTHTINCLMKIIDYLPLLQQILKAESKSDIAPKKLVELLKNIKTNIPVTSNELNTYFMKLVNKLYHSYKYSDVQSAIGKEMKELINRN